MVKRERPKTAVSNTGYLFKDILQLFAGKIRNRGVNVLIEGGEEVSVYGALGQISQAMANLIANAIQAVPVGGQIGLSAREDGDMTEIIVRDNGHGMNDEALRHLFEPFYSTKGDLGNGPRSLHLLRDCGASRRKLAREESGRYRDRNSSSLAGTPAICSRG